MLIASPIALADMDEHTDSIFHAFKLQADNGEGRDNAIARWELDGWVGGDNNKLWLKSQGEKTGDQTEKSELWAMYSRNIDTFWDAQIGIRHDNKPQSTSYLALGLNGLTPYFFETKTHVFVSDDNEVSFRIHEENDFLITQQWILKPYGEINIYQGNSDGEIGLQLRYEITRKLAPYVDLRHTRGDNGDDLIIAAGLQVIF